MSKHQCVFPAEARNTNWWKFCLSSKKHYYFKPSKSLKKKHFYILYLYYKEINLKARRILIYDNTYFVHPIFL